MKCHKCGGSDVHRYKWPSGEKYPLAWICLDCKEIWAMKPEEINESSEY